MAMDLEKKENPDLEEDGAAAPQSVEAESGAAEWPEDGQDPADDRGAQLRSSRVAEICGGVCGRAVHMRALLLRMTERQSSAAK